MDTKVIRPGRVIRFEKIEDSPIEAVSVEYSLNRLRELRALRRFRQEQGI